MKVIALTATLALTANAASLRSSSRDALRQLQTDDTSIAACEWTGGKCGTNADCPSCWPDEHYFKSDCYWFATEECGLCKTVGECESETTTSTPAPTPEPTVASTSFPTTSPTVSPTESTTESAFATPSETLIGGSVVDVDDEVIASTSSYADTIYVYETDGTTKTLSSSYSGYDGFGYSVSISGDYLSAGAMYNSAAASSAGAAYVFQRSSSGTWSQIQTITASDAYQNQFFGKCVALSGNHLLVGSTESYEVGAVYFYELNSATGLFEEGQKVKIGSKFGQAISVDGDIAAIAAPKGDQVYIYQYSSGAWSQVQVLSCPSCTDAEVFGESVAIRDGLLVVGAKAYSTWATFSATSGYEGRAFIYSADSSGTFSLDQTLTGPSTWSYFGTSVDVRDSKIIVGAPGVKDGSITEAGSAFVYRLVDGTWTLSSTLSVESPDTRDRVGMSTRLMLGGTSVVGASGVGSTGAALKF